MTIKVVVRDGCPYCDLARLWFRNNNITVDLTIINDYQERQKFYDEHSGKLGYRISTVPQIWIDDNHIGGWDNLQKTPFFLNRSGVKNV